MALKHPSLAPAARSVPRRALTAQSRSRAPARKSVRRCAALILLSSAGVAGRSRALRYAARSSSPVTGCPSRARLWACARKGGGQGGPPPAPAAGKPRVPAREPKPRSAGSAAPSGRPFFSPVFFGRAKKMGPARRAEGKMLGVTKRGAGRPRQVGSPSKASRSEAFISVPRARRAAGWARPRAAISASGGRAGRARRRVRRGRRRTR